MEPNPDKRSVGRRRFLGLAGAGAVIGIAGCTSRIGTSAAAPSGSSPTPTEPSGGTPTPAGTETAEPTPTLPTPTLTVRDQKTVGDRIVIEQVSITRTGWLAVRPPAEGGGPNPDVTLGAKRLQPGSHGNLALDLENPIERSGGLYAVLHEDDPPDGEFTFPSRGDGTVTVDGQPVVERFEVTVTAAVSPAVQVRDQEIDGKSITVAGVAIDEPGWVVIHPQAENGGPDRTVVLGRTRLQAGSHTGVVVTLDEPVRRLKRLYAALYYDASTGGGSAASLGPAVQVGDKAVVESFSISMDRPTQTISIDRAFDPRGVRIEPGTSVLWVNEDLVHHSVTIDTENPKWNINSPYHRFDEKLAPSRGVRFTFWEPGAYPFYCGLHGKTQECGVVLVGDASLEGELPC